MIPCPLSPDFQMLEVPFSLLSLFPCHLLSLILISVSSHSLWYFQFPLFFAKPFPLIQSICPKSKACGRWAIEPSSVVLEGHPCRPASCGGSINPRLNPVMYQAWGLRGIYTQCISWNLPTPDINKAVDNFLTQNAVLSSLFYLTGYCSLLEEGSLHYNVEFNVLVWP